MWEALHVPGVPLALNVAAAGLFFLFPLHPGKSSLHPALSDVRQSGMLDAEEVHNGSRQQR